MKNATTILCLSFSIILAQATVYPVQVGAQDRGVLPDREQICPNNGDCPLIGRTDLIVPGSSSGILALIINIARFLIYIIAGLAVLAIVYGGFLIVIDGGDGERAGKGRKIIINAIIGLIISALPFTIVSLVSGILDRASIGDLLNGGSSDTLTGP